MKNSLDTFQVYAYPSNGDPDCGGQGMHFCAMRGRETLAPWVTGNCRQLQRTERRSEKLGKINSIQIKNNINDKNDIKMEGIIRGDRGCVLGRATC